MKEYHTDKQKYIGSHKYLQLALLILLGFTTLIFIITSCARIGEPDGGWYDETPPKVIGASPEDKAINVNSKRVIIKFNEFIKLENASEKIIVSPPQLEIPEIKGQGKSISVKLLDELKPNTTYTIDFSDAISDNNEGNPLGNYTYSFSTGNHIDTMEVSGYVLEAKNLEPIKGILVGLYSNQSDTAFEKTPMLRVSRTDSRGHFSIKGVANGDYRIYALKDADNNYFFNQKSEQIAFTPEVITPSSKPDIRQDTLWSDTLHIKSIERVPYTHFLPDDVVLRAFTEVQTNRFLLKAERKNANHFTLYYSYGDNELPKITGLNFNANNAFLEEPSLNQDTITYWIKDSTLINQDTLRMKIDYNMSDSLGKLIPKTDTLEILSRDPYTKRLKIKQEKIAKWKKIQSKNKERGKNYQTTMPTDPLTIRINVDAAMDPDKNPSFEVETPLAKIDTTKIHLYEKIDSLWYRAKYQLGTVAGNPRKLMMVGQWDPGHEYSIELDSAAFTDIYGLASNKIKQGTRIKSLDEYSTLTLNIKGMEGKHCLVQLINDSDKPVKEVQMQNNKAVFYYINPAKYYIRLIDDCNDNGKWDTGNYALQQQPEGVYYYGKQIECKAKWDITETWNPLSTPLYKQKPGAITKQKAETVRKARSRNAERAKKLGIEYNPKNGLDNTQKVKTKLFFFKHKNKKTKEIK